MRLQTQQRLRVDYAPLNLAVSLTVGAGSPLTQVFDAATGAYIPSRKLTGTVIKLNISANADDKSWSDAKTCNYVSGVEWYANGIKLGTTEATAAGWTTGTYAITTSGQEVGKLVVTRDITSGKEIQLVCKAKVNDWRTGKNIPIETSPIVLSTSVKAMDDYTIELSDSSQIIRYNPFKDKYALSIYKGAANESLKTSTYSYIKKLKIKTFSAGQLAKNISCEMYSVNSNGYETKIESANYGNFGITSFKKVTVSDETYYEAEFDMRMIDKADFTVKAFATGHSVAVATKQISFERILPNFTARTLAGAGIVPGATTLPCKVMVDCEGEIIDSPERVLDINWFTNTKNGGEVRHFDGAQGTITLANTKIGTASDNSWMDIYLDINHKSAHAVAATSEEDTYVDSEGNNIIFN